MSAPATRNPTVGLREPTVQPPSGTVGNPDQRWEPMFHRFVTVIADAGGQRLDLTLEELHLLRDRLAEELICVRPIALYLSTTAPRKCRYENRTPNQKTYNEALRLMHLHFWPAPAHTHRTIRHHRKEGPPRC